MVMLMSVGKEDGLTRVSECVGEKCWRCVTLSPQM